MVASLIILTPEAALIALVAVLPLAAISLAARRERHGRELLRLPPPPAVSRVGRVAALLGVIGLLALAATQPALRSTTAKRVRTDAQAYYVFDISRSMLASNGPTGSTRLDRAKRYAIRMRNAIPDVPTGIATVTDRVVPNLLPGSDANAATFDSTVRNVISIEAPGPSSTKQVATSLCSAQCALGFMGTDNFFDRSATKRLVVVLTDGETNPVDESRLARGLGAGPGVHLVLIHVGGMHEAVYGPSGLEPGYHPDPLSGDKLAAMAAATGGKVFGEGGISGAIGAAKAALGTGPTKSVGVTEHTTTLAPYIALAALLPLLLLLRAGSWIGGAGLRLLSAEQLRRARRLGSRGRTLATSRRDRPLTQNGS